MQLPEVNQALQEEIASAWTFTPIAWNNVPAKDFTAPGQPLLTDGTDPFILVSIDHTNSEPVEIPLLCTRYHGYIVIDVNVREDSGTRLGADYMDKLITIFEFKRIGDVRLKEFMSVGTYNITEGWATISMQFPFEFERSL